MENEEGSDKQSPPTSRLPGFDSEGGLYQATFKFMPDASAEQKNLVYHHSPSHHPVAYGDGSYSVILTTEKDADDYRNFLKDTEKTGVDADTIL